MVGNRQSGIASIYVSLAVMVILSLIVFSFSFLMRREHVQASDRKANTQARYAAETAINDARRKIYSEINTRLNDSSTDDLLQEPFDHGEMFKDYGCTNNSATPGYNPDLDGAAKDGIEYTCVTVSNSQEELIYDAINLHRSRLIIIQGVKDAGLHTNVAANPDQFTIKWDNISPDDNTSSDFAINGGAGGHNNIFPGGRNWAYGAPVLRVQFIPINIGYWDKLTTPATFKGGFNRDDLTQESFTWFLYPSLYDSTNTNDTSIDSVDIHNGTTPDGAIIPVRCSATVGDNLPCELTIKKMDTFQRKTPADSKNRLVYIIKVLPLYDKARLKISDGKFYDITKTPATVENLRFVNEQIGITATGRAGSVIYRTTEIIPVLPPYDRPEYAIDSAEDICKLISGNTNSGTVIGGAFTKTPNINYYMPTNPSTLPSSCRFD